MLLIPRTTEKAYTEQAKCTYIFIVPPTASKQAIAQAVTEQFKVTVTDVRTLMRKGKATRFSRGRHAYPGTTYRQDKKLAYVTLKSGDSIKVFEDESTTDTQKQSKAEKAQAKADTKAEKAQAKANAKAEKAQAKSEKAAAKQSGQTIKADTNAKQEGAKS